MSKRRYKVLSKVIDKMVAERGLAWQFGRLADVSRNPENHPTKRVREVRIMIPYFREKYLSSDQSR